VWAFPPILIMQQDIHYLDDEWVFWYAIRGKLAKDAEHYECTPSTIQKT
jgi:hypothetical protein